MISVQTIHFSVKYSSRENTENTHIYGHAYKCTHTQGNWKDINRGGETNYAQMVRPYISIKYVGFKFGKNTFYVYKN